MKQCPLCSRTYFDETLSYCLSDGNLLIDTDTSADDPTLVGTTEQPTVVRPSAFPGPSIQTVSRPASSSSWLKYVALFAGALILLFVGAGLAIFIVLSARGGKIDNSPNNNLIIASVSPTAAVPENRTTPRPTPAVEKSRTPDGKPTPDLADRRLTDIPKPPPPVNDPGTTRLQFRRGSVGQSFQGVVSRQRGFVLRTLSGQYLSANLRSSNGCVVFSGGSSQTGFTTTTGDSYLQIRNSCSDPASFTLNVTVR